MLKARIEAGQTEQLRSEKTLKAELQAKKKLPSEVDEVVRPHEYTEKGEYVENSGAFSKRGQGAVKLNPPLTGPLPRFDGPTVSVKFHVRDPEPVPGGGKQSSTRGSRGAPPREAGGPPLNLCV